MDIQWILLYLAYLSGSPILGSLLLVTRARSTKVFSLAAFCAPLCLRSAKRGETLVERARVTSSRDPRIWEHSLSRARSVFDTSHTISICAGAEAKAERARVGYLVQSSPPRARLLGDRKIDPKTAHEGRVLIPAIDDKILIQYCLDYSRFDYSRSSIIRGF